MGRIVMKESPESDFYVEWSSIVEAPTYSGTREEMLAHLGKDQRTQLPPNDPEARLKRCDETGTTSLWVKSSDLRRADGTPYPEEGAWDDDALVIAQTAEVVGQLAGAGLIYQQEGIASRENIFEIARRLARGEPDKMGDLLKPFNDDAADG